MYSLPAAMRTRVRAVFLHVAVLAACACADAQVGLVLDPALKPDVVDPAAASISEVIALPDGDLVVAGRFTYVNGVARDGIVRLNSDVSIDASFQSVATDGIIYNLTRSADGLIYIAGAFTSVQGQPRAGIARLHPDGSLDAGFVAALPASPGYVRAIASVSDGGLYVVRSIYPPDGVAVRIDRLLQSGQAHPTFVPIVREDAYFWSIDVTASDRIVLLSTVNGTNLLGDVVRCYLPDGLPDPGFHIVAQDAIFPSAVAVLPDESLLLGGMGGQYSSKSVIRLLRDGTLDETYGGSTPFDVFNVRDMLLQEDGSLVVHGVGLSGNPPPRISRFTAAGVYDTGFQSEASTIPENTTLHLVGLPVGFAVYGDFSSIGDAPLAHLARFGADGKVIASAGTRLAEVGLLQQITPFADDSMLVGGAFTAVGEHARTGVVRIGSNDNVDLGFPDAAGVVEDLVTDSAGRAIVLGDFPALSETTSAGIFRVSSNNTLDTSFLHGINTGIASYGTAVHLADGSMLVTSHGYLLPYDAPGILKLRPDSSIDTSFQLDTLNTGKGPIGGITDIVLDGSGRLLITGGQYGSLSLFFSDYPCIVRTDANGVVDAGFAPKVGLKRGGRQLTALPDGSAFVIGVRGDAPESSLDTLLRIKPDGAIDESFQLAVTSGEHVACYVLTPDNALLVSTVGVDAPSWVRRFTMQGVRDDSFAVSVGRRGAVYAMTFDAQGRLWLGGNFTQIDGQRRLGLARFAPPTLFVGIDGPAQVVVDSGASHTLTASVAGAVGTIGYQWFRDGVAIAGATGSTHVISGFSAITAGSYTVTVHDATRVRTSNPVRVVLPVAPQITQQPANLQGSVGGALVLRVVATGLPPPSYQWYRDGVLIAGATSSELRLRALKASDAGSYSVRVSNSGGVVTSSVAVVNITAIGVDPSFSPTAVSVGMSTFVGLAAGRSDQSMLVSTYWGEALNGASRAGVFRLASDGSLDPGFAITGSRYGTIYAVRPDGTAYVMEDVASLDTYGGKLRRVLPSGQIDPSFGPHFGATYYVRSVVPMADGRFVAAGEFTEVDGVAAAGLVRFLADGSIDPGFHAPLLGTVQQAVVAPDGSLGVLARETNGPVGLHRLLASGAVDPSFPRIELGSQNVRLELLSDGSYLVLGAFETVLGQARHYVARILPSGVLASDFSTRPGSGAVRGSAVLPDGSVRLVTYESMMYPEQQFKLVALDATGAVLVDRAFRIMSTEYEGAPAIAFLPNGDVVLGGRIQQFEQQPVPGFVKLSSAGDRIGGFQARLGTAEAVTSVAALDGGRWALGGRFTEIAGVSRPGIAVVGPDGRNDDSFVPEVGMNAGVTQVHRLAHGKMLVVGYFPPFSGGTSEQSTIVLNADGSRDRSHDALFANRVSVAGVSAAGHVYLAVPVPESMVQPMVNLRRYLADLTEDTTFRPVRIQSGYVMQALSDGRVFLFTENGSFVDSQGTTRTGLCRVTDDGLVDPTFTAPILSQPYNVVPKEAPGGKFIITGSFLTVNGAARPVVARLNDDGSLDPTFVPPTSGLPQFPAAVVSAVDSLGRVLLFGRYRSSSVLSSNDQVLTRLNADGSWDPSVDYVINSFSGHGIEAIVPRSNGDVLVGGLFISLGGEGNISVARLTSNRFQASAIREHVSIPEGGAGYLDIRLTGPVDRPAYRWTKDGEPLADGSRAVLALRGFTAADAGSYRAEVTSADGTLVQTETIDVTLSTETTVASLTPLEFAETGGLGAIRVDTPVGTAWSIEGMPDWVQVAQAPASTGSRTIVFELEPNRTGAERAATVTVAGASYTVRQRAASGRLANISTRGRVGVGADVLIVGIVTTGTGPIDFLGRGVGPTLAQFGLSSVLPNPVIDLKRGQGSIGGNDDWDAGPDRAQILSETRRVGGFDLSDGAGDAALLTTLAPGSYTAQIYDAAGGQGVALAEFFDRTPLAAVDPYTRALNISTRGRVGSGADVLIAGFVITGSSPKQVLIRGVGPGLAAFGISDHLADPFIRVVRNGATVASNDDWAFSSQRDVVAAAAQATSAFPLDPQSRDAALVATLPPGSYTAILSGADGGEGVAIVEVYDME